MPEAMKPQGPSQDDSKQLKKLLESHLSVLEHKLGRPPTMEELTDFLKGVEQPAGEGDAQVARGEDEERKSDAPAEPKVLSYRVYTGMKSEGANRVADPKKILFYETGDGRVYDTARQEWCEERPAIVDHLQSRPMMFDEQGHDIMSALVNGVLDDEDYSALDSAQMLNDHHKRVWELSKQLEAQMSSLEKSQEEEPQELAESDALEKLSEDASPEEESDYSYEHFEDAELSELFESDDVKGENVLEQIIRGAMEQAMEMSEQRVRDIVAAEFNRHMSQLLLMLEQDDQEPSQEFETASQLIPPGKPAV